jgi:hypothetical protein
MNAQAVQMRHVVGDLVALVGEQHHGHDTPGVEASWAPKTVDTAVGKKITALPKKIKAVSVKPEKLIPMDEGDFSDF